MSDRKERKPQVMYKIDQEVLAQMIAAETSGLAEANPEQDDKDLARSFVQLINSRYDYEGRQTLRWVPWNQ